MNDFIFYGFMRRPYGILVNIIIQDHLGGDTYLYKKCKANIDTAIYMLQETKNYNTIEDGYYPVETYKYYKDISGKVIFEKQDILIENYW